MILERLGGCWACSWEKQWTWSLSATVPMNRAANGFPVSPLAAYRLPVYGIVSILLPYINEISWGIDEFGSSHFVPSIKNANLNSVKIPLHIAFLYRQLSNQCEVTPHSSHFEKEDTLHIIYWMGDIIFQRLHKGYIPDCNLIWLGGSLIIMWETFPC